MEWGGGGGGGSQYQCKHRNKLQKSFAVLKNDVLLTVPVAIMLQNQPRTQGELKNVQINRKFKGLRRGFT